MSVPCSLSELSSTAPLDLSRHSRECVPDQGGEREGLAGSVPILGDSKYCIYLLGSVVISIIRRFRIPGEAVFPIDQLAPHIS